MTENKRKHPRQAIKVNVELGFDKEDYQVVSTRDLSVGGMFLVTDRASSFPVGELVHVHYLDPLHDDADTFKDAIIVRQADDGFAIAFVEMGAF